MKTLRLSDEDYLALLQALLDDTEAQESQRDRCTTPEGKAHYQQFVDDAIRLHELLQPIEYDKED